jgi:hypothetical protein
MTITLRDDLLPAGPDIAAELDLDLQSLDLSPAAYLLAHQTRWPLSRIDAAVYAYRCWWQLIRHHPEHAHAPPGADVEAFAHAHRDACSRRYEDDCRLIFGRTLHHYGLAGVLNSDDAAQQLRRYQLSQQINAAMASSGPSA